MPTTTEEILPTGFDPIVFWMEHKNKVITYAALLIVGLVAFTAYQISTQRNLAESSALFAQATKPDDFKQVIQQFPRSLAAGNAQLMLADALRSEKKYDEALSTLREFANQFPDHPLAAAGALSVATILEEQGKTELAMEDYQQISVKYAASFAAPMALMSQANILTAQGKIDDARRIYETITSQFSESLFSQQAIQNSKLLHK